MLKKRIFSYVVVMIVMLTSFAANAQIEAEAAPVDAGGSKIALGGYMALGLATGTGTDSDQVDGRFAGGGAAYVDIYFSRLIALDVGLGLLGRGIKISEDDDYIKTYLLNMEIPVGVKFNISGLQIGAGISAFIALKGKTKSDFMGVEATADWDDNSWDVNRRFNLATKLFVGYAIPVGPIAIVPGLEWTFDLLNNLKGDNIGDNKWRYTNIMFRVGVEFGL
ncbi:MAG: hypothetical protein JXR91_14320 [Deltaproteobacteria bacterium]|nr:hypothetical protein [Deltaproteobacteria bacterium]